MTFVYGLIIGLIVGWVIEWVIDLLFWRRDDQKLREELAEAETKIRILQSQLEEGQTNQRRLFTAEHDLRTCREQLFDAEAAVERLRADLNELAGKIPKDKDRLERVKGIGTVFAKRLNDAGIRTFAELAAQTPGRIREIIQPEDWQRIEPEQWIAEAKALAENRSAKEA